MNNIENLSQRIGPVQQSISRYDVSRPLNAHARQLNGMSGSWQIIWDELAELRELRQATDEIPLSQLNGQRAELRGELGDTMFGLAEVIGKLHPDEMAKDQRQQLMHVCWWVRDTELRYGLDAISAGVEVNLKKNRINNPIWAYRDYHPLDRGTAVMDRNEIVRRGLREVRKLDTGRKLNTENLLYALDHFGYTLEAVQELPVLATHFLRQVAINGLVR